MDNYFFYSVRLLFLVNMVASYLVIEILFSLELYVTGNR